MYRFLIFLTVFISSMAVFGKELNGEQLQLRRGIVSLLSSKGYNPNVDEDGDVIFYKDNVRYWVNVNENWDKPYLITVFVIYNYEPELGYGKNAMEAAISTINQRKTVKLFIEDYNYTLRSDIITKDIQLFNETFDAILSELEASHDDIMYIVNSGFGGIDLTGNKELLYNEALNLYNREDYYQAFKLFNFLAENGYPLAYSMLGMAYENGDGVAKDEKQMLKNYEKALENGQTWCAYNLGCYYYDKGNYQKALDYFKIASDTDNPFRSEAYFMIGKMFEDGKGVNKNLTQAIQNYRNSVEYSTELESNGRLALIRLGEQIEKPSEFKEISKSLLAGLSAEDMYQKGVEYENGLNNRTISLPKAYGYYKAAADRNHTDANLKMGEIYLSKYYPFKDKTKSDKYYSKAFKTLKQQEGVSGVANYHLGIMYKEGLGIEKNPDLAMGHFKNASEKGMPEANYELGLIYQQENEDVEAFNYFLKAAEKNVPAAMYEVGLSYLNGKGVNRNSENAAIWFRKCMKINSPFASEARRELRKMGSLDDEKE